MFGKPEDVDGQCNCRFSVGDDYGDNEATFRCQRVPGHGGDHVEKWSYIGDDGQTHQAELRWPAGNTREVPSLCESCDIVETCDGLKNCVHPEKWLKDVDKA